MRGNSGWRRWAGAAALLALSAACGSTIAPGARGAGTSTVAGLGPVGTGSPGGSPPGAGNSNPSGVAGSAPVGSSAAGSTASGPGPTSEATGAPVAEGATADRSPLTIGLTYTDNSGSTSALGASTSQTASQKSVAQALVRGFNAAGGIAGRKLRSVEYSFNADDSNYSTDAQAACTQFTQDNHVSVVLDTAFGIIGGFRDCLQRAGVVDITTQDEGDKTLSSAAPLHANTASMNVDRQYAAVLLGMTANGYLSKSNQLGIIVEGCPEDTNAYSHTLRPLISRLGLKPPQTTQLQCTTGFASAGPAAAAINNTILSFQQAHVDRVMFVSYNEAVVLLLFGNDADSQHYYPGYLLSSGAQAEALRSNIPSGQWPQLHGVGNSPVTDTDGAKPTAVEKRCDRLVRAGGVSPASYLDEVFVYSECGPFLLLEGALLRTNGHASATDVMSGINSLGASLAMSGVVAGRASFSENKHDGPDSVQTFGYVAGCTCMRYSGSPRSAPV